MAGSGSLSYLLDLPFLLQDPTSLYERNCLPQLLREGAVTLLQKQLLLRLFSQAPVVPLAAAGHLQHSINLLCPRIRCGETSEDKEICHLGVAILEVGPLCAAYWHKSYLRHQ